MPDPVVSPPLGKPRHSLARGALASLLGTTAAWGTWKGLDNLWERLRPKKEPQRMQFVRAEDGSIVLEKAAAAVTQHARNRRKLTLGEFTSGVARFGVYKRAQAKANANMAFDELGEQMGKAHSPAPPAPPAPTKAPKAPKSKANQFFDKMDTDPATKTYNLKNPLTLKKTSSFLGDVADALESAHSRAVDATEGLIHRAARGMGVHYDQLADAEVEGHRLGLEKMRRVRALAKREVAKMHGGARNMGAIARLHSEALGQQRIREAYKNFEDLPGNTLKTDAHRKGFLGALGVGMNHTGGGTRSALPEADPRLLRDYKTAIDIDRSLERVMGGSLKKAGSVEYRGTTFPGYNQPIKSNRSGKKMMVLAKKGDQVKLIHFGHTGYKHNYSEAAKKNYLARSAGIKGKDGKLTKDDKFSANYWARRVLWPKGPVEKSAQKPIKYRGETVRSALPYTGSISYAPSIKTGQAPPPEYAPGGSLELVRPKYVTGKTPGWEYRESIPSGNNLGTSHLKKWFPKKDRSGRQTTDEGGNLEWKKNWRLEEVGPDTTPARFKFVHDKRPLPPALQKVKEVFNKKPALDRVAPDISPSRHKKTASLPSALRAATALFSRAKGRAAMHNWTQTVGARRDPAAFGFRYDPAKDPALLRMKSRLEGKVLADSRNNISPAMYQHKLMGIRDARPAVSPRSSWDLLQNRLAVYKQRKASGFPRQPGRAEMLESIQQRRLAAPRSIESSLAAPVEIQAGAAGPVPAWQRPRPTGRSF